MQSPYPILDFKVTPTVSTAPAYTAGDVLFDTTIVTSGVKNGRILAVSLLDKDDLGEACDVYFLKSSDSLGTANSAPSITDTAAENIIGYATLSAGKDIGGARFQSAAVDISFDTSASLYVAAITSTALTHTASSQVLGIRIEKRG